MQLPIVKAIKPANRWNADEGGRLQSGDVITKNWELEAQIEASRTV
jgi:hypothetical protein